MTLPKFSFEHVHSHKKGRWVRYKFKECWTLVLCLIALRGRTGAVVIHNWWSNETLRFTREFSEKNNAEIEPPLLQASILEPHSASRIRRLLAAIFASLLCALPINWLAVLTRLAMPKGVKTIIVYCDGHLSGFLLALAASANSCFTGTLQHGLYRYDDVGSRMIVKNFVSDRMYVWDEPTQKVFLDAGYESKRLMRVGEYGFEKGRAAIFEEGNLAIICPPYQLEALPTFKNIESILARRIQTLWSLHPLVRRSFPTSKIFDWDKITILPTFAICGDSGVIMEALARNIPVIAINDRNLCSVNLSFQEANYVDCDQLNILIYRAIDSINADRAKFGFL